ncbi:MAG: radical SAM protein [Clostridiales bacterium]|jgi:wyosine [tRNA(Phe)-imidazoG37] synthetase (radical SAM superfamily)|nr:radical SAM protein [Clostridiales bacterium]
MSLDEALRRFPDAGIYVTLDTQYRYEAFHSIVSEFGINETRILNYEPVELRVSCEYLDNYIAIINQILQNGKLARGLSFCCAGHGVPENHPLIEFSGTPKETFEKFLQLRSDLLFKLNSGLPSKCDGCVKKIRRYQPLRHIFTKVILGSLCVCNFDCFYCYRHDLAFSPKDLSDELDVSAFLQLAKNYNGDNTENLWVYCAYGEITAHPPAYREKIYQEIRDFDVQFVTNASIYDEFIHQHLKTRKGSSINVSLDCGTHETFKRIKGRAMFPKVLENLRKYNEGRIGQIWLKYIFLPGVNDNENDVAGFVAIYRELNVDAAIISSDTHTMWYEDYNTKKMFTAVNLFKQLCDKNNVDVVNWSDVTIGRILAEQSFEWEAL